MFTEHFACANRAKALCLHLLAEGAEIVACTLSHADYHGLYRETEKNMATPLI